MGEKGTDGKGGVDGRDGVSCGKEYLDEKQVERTLVLLVEGTVATPPAEGVGLGVPLTVGHRTRLLRKRGAWHWTNSPEGGGT